MDAIEAILTRRSVRSYSSTPVSEELVTSLLEAAMQAPSAGNEQPWHFVVITERQVLDAIPAIHPYAKMLLGAPLAIVVCGDLRLEKHHGYWTQDCAAAMENLLLAAHALGLGGVWVGVYPVAERIGGLRDLLGLPEHIIPFAMAGLGYPAALPEPARRFNPDRIHRNRWTSGM